MNNVLASLGRGRATGGTKTTLVDARKNFEADLFNGTIIKMNIGGIDYFRTITDTANSTLTFGALPGAKGSGIWTVSDGVTITVTTVADTATDYTLEAKLATGNNKPLAVALDGTVIRVTLATDANGSSDDAKNTVTLVTAAIDALPEFTAVASGDGSTVCTPTSAPVSFSGGVDEVKPTNGVHYEIRRRDAAQIFGSDGTDLIPVKVGADGSLYVGGITVESVTAANVGISQTEGENVVEDRALAALIGEVQATPTANTLLARLKSLEDKIDAITDGTSPAVTQLSGSTLAIPVDLQYQTLGAPLPVSQATQAIAYESITVAGTAKGFTAGTFGTATHAFITCEDAQLRFRIDGENPTASEGHLLNPGDTLKLDSPADIARFRAIRTSAISAVLKVTFSEVV